MHWLFPKLLLFQNNQSGKGAHFRAATHCPQHKLRKTELAIHRSWEIRSLEPSPSTAPPRSTFFRRFSRCGPILGSLLTEQIEGDQNFVRLLIPNLNSRCSLFVATQEQIHGSRELHVWVPKFLSFSLKSVLLVNNVQDLVFHS